MAKDCLRKGMRFLLLLPRTLSGCWVLKYCMHCVPQTFLWEHLLENRKERGTIRDLFAYISLPTLLCTTEASPCISPCNRYKSTAASLCAVLTACASAKCLSSQPMEAPAAVGVLRSILLWASSSRDSPCSLSTAAHRWEPRSSGQSQAGVVSSTIDPGSDWSTWVSVSGLYEHYNFIKCNFTSNGPATVSQALQTRRNKANLAGKVQGSTNLNLLHFQDSSAIWIENCMVLDKVPIFNFSVFFSFAAENHTMYFPANY